MRRMRWLACLWPGLPQLSSNGSWPALLIAVVAAALLNLGLLGTLAWSELLGGAVRNAIWLLVAGTWATAAVWTWRQWRRKFAGPPEGPDRNGFAAAIEHYLQGNWFEAERLLLSLLNWDEADGEARLMLATLLRHRQRFDEAAQHLEQLQGMEAAWKWEWEICRERQLLSQAQAERQQANNEEPSTDHHGGITPAETSAENVRAA
jgi:hypothetical protein